jgi:Tol biopolymer transport system component
MKSAPFAAAAVFLAAILCAYASPAPCAEAYCGNYPHRVSMLKVKGGRVDWSKANGLIAYDRPGANGVYYDLHVMSADGTVDRCLTCGKNGFLPQKNNGNPTWHPSGDYIVFQSEVADSAAAPFASNPGRGINNVLWVTDASGREFHQLTELSTSDATSGVLHPHFSPDGTRLAWTEIYEGSGLQTGMIYGHWRLVWADFVVGADGGPPSLRNVQKMELGDPAFYEIHGFSPDGSRLVFSSNLEQSEYLGSMNNDIFLLDLTTFALTRLTDQNYNEHAQFFPKGRKIVWMTNTDVGILGADLWIMNEDGSGKERLTFFNNRGCPEYDGRVIVSDNSVNAAGDKLVAFIQDQTSDSGSIVLVELDGQP